MRLHNLTTTHPHKKARRVGRGISAGQGKTAGRGTKGQKARTGANSNIPRTFDGGSTSLIQRLPKLKGFKSRRVKPVTLSVTRIATVLDAGETISLTLLVEKGLVDSAALTKGVKIVGGRQPITATFTFDSENPKLKVSASLLKR